jgi:hypothetical protein
MPFAPKAPIDLALQERIRVAYYLEGRPIAEMEAVAGVGKATLYRWFHAWGWPLRKPMRSRGKGAKGAPVLELGAQAAGPAAASAAAPPGGEGWRLPAGRETLKARLRRLVAHRIAMLEHESMSGAAIDPEANARAIELNARTLATIEKLNGEAELCPKCRDEPPPRSLNELRDELRRHLTRVMEQRAILPGQRGDEAEGDGALRASEPAAPCAFASPG